MASSRTLPVILILTAILLAPAERAARGGQTPGGSGPGNLEDHGTFVLSQGGKQIGAEVFDIRASGDKVEAEAKIQLRLENEGKVYDFRTSPKLVLDSSLRPLTYTWSQKGPPSSKLEVDFRSTPVKTQYRTVAGEDDRRDFELAKDVLVLDDNVMHHYQLVVYRYRRAGGGRQTFPAFIPQEALPGSLQVEEIGQESLNLEGRTSNLRHVVVSTDLARIDLWVDDQDHLQQISIPAAQFEAVRQR